MGAVVVGQLARDVVMVMERLPDAGSSGPVRERLEQLGGKGANQAVGLSQLGVPAALVAVAGDDPVGDALLARAAVDGVDVSHVVRRAGTPTGLIVEVLEDGGRWRYLEHLPQGVLLTEADVRAAEGRCAPRTRSWCSCSSRSPRSARPSRSPAAWWCSTVSSPTGRSCAARTCCAPTPARRRCCWAYPLGRRMSSMPHRGCWTRARSCWRSRWRRAATCSCGAAGTKRSRTLAAPSWTPPAAATR